MRYLMTLLVVVGIGFSFVPNSFRSQSTAYLFEDDYDLIFDPARLPLIEGSRLYTNLSNLVSSNEDVFGPISMDYYLFAGSTKLGSVYPGMIYDNYSANDPNYTGLRDRFGDSLYGDAQTDSISLFDLDGNGLYDYKTVDARKASAWDKETNVDFLFGLGKRAGENMRIGFGYLRFVDKGKYIFPYANHVYDRKDSNLVSAIWTFSRYDSATGEYNSFDNGHEFHLSGWRDAEKMSMGLGVKFVMESYGWDNIAYDSLDENRSPSNPAVIDYKRIRTIDSSNFVHSGFSIPVTAKVFYNWNEKTQSRFYLTYEMGNFNLVDDATAFGFVSVDSTCRPGSMLVNDTIYHNYFGKYSESNITLNTQHFFKVSDRVDLAFGLGIANETYSDEVNDSMVTYRHRSYNDGDTLADRDDTTFVTTGIEYWKSMGTGVARSLWLPVGVEFKVINPLVLRLGAIHTITMYDDTQTENLVEINPLKTKVTLGDGTTYETIANQMRKPSTVTPKPTTSVTTYTYGLGWAATENLQIDLMGFARLTDLTNWKLSATFKF